MAQYDNYAEALDGSVVCVMTRDCVGKYLLSDARIATASPRFSARASLRCNAACPDSVFKSVPQRVAATLATLAGDGRRLGVGPRATAVALTHERLAALAGTSRETTTKVLGDLAERGLIRLGRGRITVLDPAALAAQAGD